MGGGVYLDISYNLMTSNRDDRGLLQIFGDSKNWEAMPFVPYLQPLLRLYIPIFPTHEKGLTLPILKY